MPLVFKMLTCPLFYEMKVIINKVFTNLLDKKSWYKKRKKKVTLIKGVSILLDIVSSNL